MGNNGYFASPFYSGQNTGGGGHVAPSDATYIVQSPDASLPNAQALNALATGYVKVTTGTGVLTSQDIPIPVTDGGTGTTTSTGTGSVVLSAAPTFTGHVTVPTPTQGTDAANKSYVDSLAQGLSPKASVQEATTTTLPANTYNNGASGVGATLTGNATGTLTVDGVLTALGDRILVKNEAAPANNGIYLVTTAGAIGTAYVLTRATDSNTSAEIQGEYTFVQGGTVNTGASFVNSNTGGITIGTTAITYVQFTTASVATTVAITDDTSTNATMYPTWVTSNSGNLPIKVSSTKITFNPSTATLTTTTFSGALSGNATTATTATNSTNAATTTKSDNTTYYLTFVAANSSSNQGIDVGSMTYNPSTSTLTATTFVGALTGNASTATALQTGRTINGVTFDGTANIVVTAAAGTLTGTTLNATVVSSSLTSVGTIATGVWNGTTIDVAHGGTNNTTFTAYSVICAGTTATGAFQNVSGLGASGTILTSNGAGTLPSWQAAPAGSTVAITNDNATNANMYPTWVTTASGNQAITVSSTKLTFNPSLGAFTTGIWQGSLIALAYGGTNANLTASNGGIFYSTASAGAILSGTATANQILYSGASSAPAWSTPTFPVTASATSRKIIVSDGTNWVASTETWATPGSSGNVLTSDGTNWTSAPAASAVYPWTDVTGTSASMAVNNGYIADNAGLVTLTLPSTAALGSTIRVAGLGAGLWKIAQNASQVINFGNIATTSGTGGSVAAINRYDAVELLCVATNNTWTVLSSQGTMTIV